MPRAIITRTLHSAEGADVVDDFADRVIKFIPGDVVAAWVAAGGVLRGTTNPKPGAIALWATFAVGLAICAVWTYVQVAKTNKDIAKLQMFVSTGAFVVWVYALGGPFPDWLGWYRPYVGSLLLIAYTALAGVLPYFPGRNS
jgi:hypothetical protein